MHRLAVSICANGLIISALTLAACAPETAPAANSSATSQSAKNATQTPLARNTPGNNAAPARMGMGMGMGMDMDMDPTLVMRTATANAMPQAPAAQAGSSAQDSPAQAARDVDASTQNAMGAMGAMGAATLPTLPAAPTMSMRTMSTAGMAASQPDASAPSPGNAACTALSTCCAALTDDDDREDCQEVAERDDAGRCTRVSEEVCQAQGMPTTPATASEACTKLGACCGTLPRLPQRECQQAVMRADDERCTRQLVRTCPELGPPPRDPACVTLQGCCPKLTEPRALELCRRALQEDEARDCLEASAALCQ